MLAFSGFFALPLLTALYLDLPQRRRFDDVGYAVSIVGTGLFGAALIRSGRYPRMPSFAYPVVLPVFAVSATLPYSPYKGFAHAALAAVLVWLALDLTARQRPAASAAEPDPAASVRMT